MSRRTISELTTQADLESKLNDFDPATRTQALSSLLALYHQDGATDLPTRIEAANMHAHTFFSFNAYGHSPTSLVWLALKNGYTAIGSVDFDVLDAVDEFLATCELAGVRGSSALETRVYIPEFSTREINSPGEPGVAYHMGIGFTSSHAQGNAADILTEMRSRAAQRNRDLVARVNAYLAPVTIDYDRDVLPLTPAGNATERHILVAYTRAVEQSGADPVAFWSAKLSTPHDVIRKLVAATPELHNLMRSKLMKRGGVGYVQPGPDAFTSVDEFHTFVQACNALPCATWLDGTSTGEKAIDELLNLLISKGVVALNIIPDRNWNIADPEQKRIKLQNLYHVVRLAHGLDLPINVGTEMNAFGQKLIDDFTAPELAPVKGAFLDGAYFIYGHTMMQRHLNIGYQSKWAASQLPSRAERNSFYTWVGRGLTPGITGVRKLQSLSADLTPAEVLIQIGR